MQVRAWSQRFRDEPEPDQAVGGSTSGKAIIVAVRGLSALFFMVLKGLPALILGYMALRDSGNGQGFLRDQGWAYFGVTLGIVGIVETVLFPAVLNLRDAAARMTTICKMKQIGMASHGYHDTHGHFPEAGTAAKNAESVGNIVFIQSTTQRSAFYAAQPATSYSGVPDAIRYSFWTKEHPGKSYAKHVLVICFEGTYHDGSSGNPDASFMLSMGNAGVQAFNPDAIILDLSALKYEWGDEMDCVFGIGGDRKVAYGPGHRPPLSPSHWHSLLR